MARPLRIEYEGAVYHVTARGNAKQTIFVDNGDRQKFLMVLGDVVSRFHWNCHAYCLMSNHYHLVIETLEANLSRGMRQLNGVYTQSFNRHHDRGGHVMQGRFKSILVEKESHLLELARYVVLNPVRAKMVPRPSDWPWSSYAATAGEQPAPSFLSTEWLLAQFGDERKLAARRYRKFVEEGLGVDLWGRLRGGVLIGSDEFVDEMAPRMRDSALQREIPRRERLLSRPSLDELFSGAGTKLLRDERIYEATRIHEYSLSELQEFLGLHYSTISRIASRVQAQNSKRQDLTP